MWWASLVGIGQSIEIIFLISTITPFIWGAWICTKMITKYFNLAGDYSYKAAISKGYIGFKEQTKGLDTIFQERLLAAAITQLDANPLRLIESSGQPGSPIQDLLQQPFMQDALENDNFKKSVTDWLITKFKNPFNRASSKATQQTESKP